MSQLQRAGQNGALDVAASQAVAKDQVAVILDMLRQLGGNPSVVAGAAAPTDPLNAPFTLYVDPYIGSDRFVGGAYNSHEAGATDEEVIAQKLKRIELQRLECGYTSARPFKTINRAVIEAAIITSKNWYTYTDPRAHVDCVSIVLAPGVHILYNDPGSSSTGLASWGDTKDPTTAELIAFNPAAVGGVLLPRGCSLCGPDLRKTTIRPNWVPAVADEAADYSNRRAMLKVTGTGYFFGHTFMDKVGYAESHHLLDPYGPASKTELDGFYAKCLSAVGSGADLSAALTVTRPTEYEIVGPIDTTQSPTSAWDTTASASPYIFNCSVRSNYGMGGAFWDGAKVGGLKSMVCANFTGVSLQKDMRCWQVYESGNWVTLTNTPQSYQKYISSPPDNVRMNPARMSRHITAINDAFIQEVSVFAIGHGIHHYTDAGGEITVTNSNSSFGGCAALSKGYKAYAFGQDRNWTIGRIRLPLNVGEKVGNVRRIFLGSVSAISGSTITLETPLAIDETDPSVPALLAKDGYSLASGTKVWVENPIGNDWRTDLTGSAWSSSAANQINITTALTEAETNAPVGLNPETSQSLAIGKRVYIRRLVDTRSPSERRLSLQLNNTASARIPERNFVLQTDPARVGGGITRTLADGSELILVSATGVGSVPGQGIAKTAEVTVRRGAPSVTYQNNTFYRAGTVVKYANKHYQSLQDQVTDSALPDLKKWGETFVHMPSDYNAEDQQKNESPIITFDTDTDPDINTQTCGINWTTAWTGSNPLDLVIQQQYRTGTDYLGAYALLRAFGFTDAAAHAALVPQAAASRDRDPSSSVDFPTAPSGGAASGRANWAIEFRRPSMLRLYGHAFEWAGYLNYSKSIPAAQKDLGPQNKFTYYFTNSEGGRVVPQGSNEDGFNVTPQGLEDIETGATLSVDAIGSSTLDEFQRTDFPNGLTASEITVDRLVVNNSVELPDVSAASTTTTGPVRLADAAALRSQASIAGSNDTQRNNSINAEPDVVTIKALNYWKLQNRLVSARPGVQYVYVDPINGRDVTNINTLLAEPPITETGFDGSGQRQAVAVRTLRAAADYANQAYGPSTTVEFRCGPGVYLDRGRINFTTNAIIRAWSFSANTYLNDSMGGGTVPFATANFYDSTKQPVFLTQPRAGVSDVFVLSYSTPLILDFAELGWVIGCVWWGIMTTITSSAVPDSFFLSGGFYTGANSSDPNNWRALARAGALGEDNALNYFIREHAMKAPTPGRYYGHRIFSCCKFQKSGRIANVGIGALSPADITLTGGVYDAAFECSADGLTISGLRMVGNCKISNDVNTGSFAAIRYRGTANDYSTVTYSFTGWALSLVGSSTAVAVVFGTEGAQDGWNGLDGTAIYNHAWNNVELLNNSLQFATTTSPSGSGWKTIGPAIRAVIGGNFATSASPEIVSVTGERNWSQFRIAPNSSAGFSGKFGSYVDSYLQELKPFGAEGRIRSIAPLSAFFDTPYTVFRVAGSGTLPSVSFSGLDPGDVGAYVDFSDLNVRVRAHKQGVDVDNAYIHYGDFTL